LTYVSANWSATSISNLCETAFDGLFGSNLKSADYSESGVRVVRLENIGHLHFREQLRTFIARAKYRGLAKYTLVENDIVFSSFVDEELRVCLIPQTLGLAINKADCFCLRINRQKALPQFVMYRLATPDTYSDFKEMVRGVTRPRINISHLKKYEIATPPIPEQLRIVESLNSVIASIDKCRERLDRVSQILKRFRAAVLEAAVSGRLTQDWRRDLELTGWATKRAAEVCTVVQSGGTPKAGFTELSGVPFLKVYNIVDQHVAFEYRPQYVPSTTHEKELRKSRTLPGDVLMNIVGPPLGKVAVVPDAYPEWNINQAITLFRPGPEISTQWLYTVLCSGRNVAEVIHQTRGSVGQVNISLSQCRDFDIPVPPHPEQAEIARRLAQLFALADSLQRRYRDSATRIEKLTPSVLAKAFRGELVPQDPNDVSEEILSNESREPQNSGRVSESPQARPRNLE
jgi:type I restriction enzyme S subunit